MKVYTCTSFKGFNPVGTAAVVIAKSEEDAANLLNGHLIAKGLEGRVLPREMWKIKINQFGHTSI